MTDERVFVVTPTYNEKDNVEFLVRKIFSLGIPNLEMVIVDDNSPDGTGRIAEELAKIYPMRVIHREKKMGLGTAYVAAFKTLLGEKLDYIIQMDADLSHNPADIPRFIEKASKHDVVLGSRYVKGGSIKNWDFLRKLISRFGNFYSRFILWVPYRDLTGGFKCYRKAVLASLDLDSLSSLGYNFQIETTYKAHQLGHKIHEIPITFTERKSGDSKFNLGIIIESFLKVILLRLRG